MRKLVTFMLMLCCTSISVSAQSQDPQKDPPFITLIDVGAGTTFLEMGLSGRVGYDLAIALSASRFINPKFTNITSRFMVNAKAKYYAFDIRPEPYVGVMLGVHGFDDGIHPTIGAHTGFDIYAGGNMQEDEILTRMGLDFNVGVDANGNRFFGATLSFGLGWINNKSEPYSIY